MCSMYRLMVGFAFVAVSNMGLGGLFAADAVTPNKEILPARMKLLRSLYGSLKDRKYEEALKACNTSDGSASLSDLQAVTVLQFTDKQILSAKDNLKGQTITVRGMKGKVTKVDEKGFQLTSSGMSMTLKWKQIGGEVLLQAAKLEAKAGEDAVAKLSRELWLYFNGKPEVALKNIRAIKGLDARQQKVQAFALELDRARIELGAEKAYEQLAKALKAKNKYKATGLAKKFISDYAETDFILLKLGEIVAGVDSKRLAASTPKSTGTPKVASKINAAAPLIKGLFRGKIDVLKGTTCKFSYDFKDPNQMQDWATAPGSRAKWEIKKGQLHAPSGLTPLWLKGLFQGDAVIHIVATGVNLCRIGGMIHGTSRKWQKAYMFQLIMSSPTNQYMNLKHYHRYFSKKGFPQYRKGKVYDYLFIRKGNHLSATLDGRMVMQGNDDKLTRGYIGMLGGAQATMVYHSVEITATLQPEWVKAETKRFVDFRVEKGDVNAFPPPKLNITLWEHETKD